MREPRGEDYFPEIAKSPHLRTGILSITVSHVLKINSECKVHNLI